MMSLINSPLMASTPLINSLSYVDIFAFEKLKIFLPGFQGGDKVALDFMYSFLWNCLCVYIVMTSQNLSLIHIYGMVHHGTFLNKIRRSYYF